MSSNFSYHTSPSRLLLRLWLSNVLPWLALGGFYLASNTFGEYDRIGAGHIVMGVVIMSLLSALLFETVIPYVYQVEVTPSILTLKVVRIFGQKAVMSYPVKEVSEVEFEPEKPWKSRKGVKIYIHRGDKVRAYRLKDGELGDRLSQVFNSKMKSDNHGNHH